MVLDQNRIKYYQDKINELKKEHLYRYLKPFDTISSDNTYNPSHKVLNFSSNDYLGLSKNSLVVNKLRNMGISHVSQCSSRLITGNSSNIESLEKRLAEHRKTQSALVFPTGYMANLGVLGCIADKESMIFSDELNHASIIDGCKLSNSQTQIFPHNDISALERTVKMSDSKKKIIITEGIFSMNGDLAKLKEISKISDDHNCILIVDDSHGDFIIGNRSINDFSGTPSFFGKNENVDIHISSLSKGLGCFGGYVSSTDLIREYLINKSRPFIFTSAFPDLLCEAAKTSIDIAYEGLLQDRLYKNINFFYELIEEYKILDIIKVDFSPIIPLIIGPERKTLVISSKLLKQGFFVQAIRYPTVYKNAARLRISLSAEHTFNEISSLIDNLAVLIKNYN